MQRPKKFATTKRKRPAKMARRHVYVLETRRALFVLTTAAGSYVSHWWKRSLDLGTGYTKAQAVRQAAELLMSDAYALTDQHSELRIRRADGTIGETRTYPKSSDPRRTKG